MDPTIPICNIEPDAAGPARVASLRAKITSAASAAPSALIIDLSGEETIDSECVGVLFLVPRVVPSGCRVVIAAGSQAVRRSLAVSHIDRLYPIVESLGAAQMLLARRDHAPK